jgi:hypothetical protein
LRSPALAALLIAGTVLAAEPEVRVFQLHFRAVREAADLIEPLLSADGSILLQPKISSVTVRDNAEVLARVTQALASWDVPPLSYRVRVRLLLATTEAPDRGRAAPMIAGVGAEITKLFHFTEYQDVATVQVTAAEGSAVELAAGDRYNVRFTVRGVSQDPDRIQLAQLQLARRDRSSEGQETLQPLLRATVPLQMKQASVLGGMRSENAKEALFLILWAEREERP